MFNSPKVRRQRLSPGDPLQKNWAGNGNTAAQWQRINRYIRVGTADSIEMARSHTEVFHLRPGLALQAVFAATPPAFDSTFEEAHRWNTLLQAASREIEARIAGERCDTGGQPLARP